MNKWTFDQTLFNPIRAKRPMNNNFENKTPAEVADEFELIPGKCDFCSPIAYTAIGTFFLWINDSKQVDAGKTLVYF